MSEPVVVYAAGRRQPGEEPGIVEGRLWWEQSTVYHELPFYSELGLTAPADWADRLAAREQLFAIREADEEMQPF